MRRLELEEEFEVDGWMGPGAELVLRMGGMEGEAGDPR